MPSVWQTNSKRTGIPHRQWRFYFTDYLGRRCYGTGTKDYEQTAKLAMMLEDEHREIRLGLRPVPSENELIRPFPEVVEEYLAWGKAQGGRRGRPWSPTHLRNKKSRLEWWRNQHSLTTLGDLRNSLSKVEKALRELKEGGRASKTVTDYGDALESFCRWCVQREYLPENPLKHLRRMVSEPKEIRRALTLIEIERLLKVASPKRRLIYLLALITGLRANELASLLPKHVDDKNGGLILDARWTKNRKSGFVALPETLFNEVQLLAKMRNPTEPFLDMPTHTARTLDIDLKAARIPKRTEEGKIDFHALRTTFVTLTIESGATPKEAQELARHSTVDLTHNTYARARKDRLTEITQKVAESIGS